MNQEEQSTFNRTFWRFLLSSILIALSGCLGNVVDAIIVGNLIGEDGVSAINLTKPIIQLMFTLNMFLATGAGMLVGIELGRKNHQGAAGFYSLSMAATLAVGLLFTASGLLIPDVVTGWICTDQHLFQPTLDYLRVILIGAPVYLLMWALTTMAGVDGSPRLASFAILIDNAVNLSLDIVFIRWLGWGIEGSSAATVVGHIVGIAIMCRHFHYKDNHLRLTSLASSHLPLFSSLGKIISQGAPLAIAVGCLGLLFFATNNSVATVGGSVSLFALAVCMNLLQIYNLFLAGIARTIQALGSIEVGRGDNEAFRLVLRKSFNFITIAMSVTCLIVWIVPEFIARLFGAEGDATVSETVRALRPFSLSIMLWCYIDALITVYKLYNYHGMALFISFALSLTVIPVLWLISRYSPDLLWYSYLIAYAIEVIAIVALHKMTHVKFELKPAG